ncbi:Transcriptional coactivator/pterin dehydratase [Quillaja saponaria]|uniref:4a-hydroxytetrahydrobiopterin dehydratase n=1 Tax=Quillaja saponaria TaxID=32244 RepID=A0AAD7M2Q4_QUISA|nr:Transcriptional coactivator/pterin dehydratase [Quillaja saponaria]
MDLEIFAPAKVLEWNLVHEGGTLKLNQSWKVKSFTKGLELFKIVVDVAEAEGHHPYLQLVGWNNVTIEICTHAVAGHIPPPPPPPPCTHAENDFILAAKINGLDVQHLLGWKPAD